MPKLSPQKISEAQHKWLMDEKIRTGQTVAAIIRNLIQDKIDKTRA